MNIDAILEIDKVTHQIFILLCRLGLTSHPQGPRKAHRLPCLSFHSPCTTTGQPLWGLPCGSIEEDPGQSIWFLIPDIRVISRDSSSLGRIEGGFQLLSMPCNARLCLLGLLLLNSSRLFLCQGTGRKIKPQLVPSHILTLEDLRLKRVMKYHGKKNETCRAAIPSINYM